MQKDTNSDSPSPQVIRRRRWLPWREWLLAAVLGITVLMAGVFIFKRYNGRHTARAQQLANEASAFMAQKFWTDAKSLLISAFKPDNTDPLVLRTCAIFEREAVNNLECA